MVDADTGSGTHEQGQVRFRAILDEIHMSESARALIQSISSHFSGKKDDVTTPAEGTGASDETAEAKDKSEKPRFWASLAKELSAKDDSENDDEEKQAKKNKAVINTLNGIGDGLKAIMDASLNVMNEIHDMLKRSSPLLETVESLFTLAMQLLFMPLGNALAETILPALIDLVDKVVDMWTQFDDLYKQGGLSAILAKVMNDGVKLIGNTLEHMGDLIKTTGKENSEIGKSIGNMLKAMGKFIATKLPTLINVVAGLASWVLDNMPLLISLITAFKVASLTFASMTAIATMYTAFSAGALVGIISGGLITGLAVGAVSGMFAGLATGGYVPATEGGREIVVAEGGEGEFVIPESKVESFANQVNSSHGGDTYNITINGMTNDELKDYINDVIKGQIKESSYKRGFM